MKKKLAALVLCFGVLGFGVFGNVGQLENTNPVQYMVDPGGS
ncbi:hypothetical protein [Bacillus pseudomycoides]|nr:hypothetical protein [Bacillus pseudomycoides]